MGTGLALRARKLVSRYFLNGDVEYKPLNFKTPPRLIHTPKGMAWYGLESVLFDLTERFCSTKSIALEFGVQYGFSTVALSNYFEHVIGVDTFEGDIHAGHDADLMSEASANLKPFENISLIKSTYQDFISTDTGRYDLIHIDIVHTFDDTFACGQWALQHSDCVIFHDTQSFPAVKKAVSSLAKRYNKSFFNFYGSNGLGILV